MDMFWKRGPIKNIYFYVYLTCILSLAYAEDTCVKKTPCSCEFSNGTGIDLSATAKSKTFYTTQTYLVKDNSYELTTYYYHPCYDISLNQENPTGNDTCGVNLSICRHVTTLSASGSTGTYNIDHGVYNYMGSSNVTEFTTATSIKYANGPASTMVLLVCAEVDGQLHVYSLSDPRNVVLAFYSSEACLKQLEEVGRSFGSTLLIIFFSCVIFYLVLGVCTKKFLMGATGIEVIPNLAFWSDLPNLVKDGWAFAMNGFKLPPRGSGPTISPDPNSYDSI